MSTEQHQRQQKEQRPNKRKRDESSADETLPLLCLNSRWDLAKQRVQTHPSEASETYDSGRFHKISSTPLALACRLGAHMDVIAEILMASPIQLRRLIPSYGTPLHEAIVCESIDSRVISLLLEADQQLDREYNTIAGGASPSFSRSNRRAALMQDVDGHTPLHLLIRRRSSALSSQRQHDDWMSMLQALVKSCPQAVEIPDCGEYEEPPLVMALKASLYNYVSSAASATNNNNNDDDQQHVPCEYQNMEQRIFDICQIMLEHYPQAACRILTGARGQYTALHSAVFHGRCSKTIQLLLQAEQLVGKDNTSTSIASLLANTQGELPLHFCAMRGEPPKTIGLLSAAAPQALLTRDSTGFTPMHWLWVRFVSGILSLQENNNNNNNNNNEDGEQPQEGDDNDEVEEVGDEAIVATTVVGRPQDNDLDTAGTAGGDNDDDDIARYSSWSELESGNDYYADLRMIRRIDPPVDFLHMRHIPTQLLREGNNGHADFESQTQRVLQHIFGRYQQAQQQIQNDTGENNNNDDDEQGMTISWTRREALTALFWTKVVSCLHSSARSTKKSGSTSGRFLLTHTAVSTLACPPAIARIITALYPKELLVADEQGKLPLHHAATRLVGHTEPPDQSVELLQRLLTQSPTVGARVADKENRLPLHHAIDTIFRAACNRCDGNNQRRTCYCWISSSTQANTALPLPTCPVQDILDVIRGLVKNYPDSLERRDGKTKLYPFLQATAAEAEYKTPESNDSGHGMPVSVTFMLLRANPSLLKNLNPGAGN